MISTFNTSAVLNAGLITKQLEKKPNLQLWLMPLITAQLTDANAVSFSCAHLNSLT